MEKIYLRNKSETLFSATNSPKIISLSKVEVDSSWYYGLHKHDDYCEIMFILEGKGDYTINNKKYLVEEGDLIVLNRGVVHAESSYGGNILRAYVCSVENIKIENFEENCILPDDFKPVMPTSKYAKMIRQCFEDIYNEMSEQSLYYDSMTKIDLLKIILTAKRIANELAQDVDYSSVKYISQGVKSYIDKHYMDQLTLDSLAKIFHLSKYHIVHEMKKDMGISPINYLIGLRVGEAQRLLLATDLSVTSISKVIGYDNVSYFMHLFHKKTGVSPTEFRALYKISNTEKS